MKFSKKLLTVALATPLMGLGAINLAHAGAASFSTVNVSNFTWSFIDAIDGTGTVTGQIDAGDFSTLDISNFSAATAILNGSSAADDVEGQGDVDVTLQCVGNCAGIGEDDYTNQPRGNQFSRGDSQLNGAIITGTPASDADADADTVAEVQIEEAGANSGSANSEVSTGSEVTFDFAFGSDVFTRFDFDASYFLQAVIDAGEDGAAAATSTYRVLIEEIDASGEAIDTVLSWDPNGGAGGVFGSGTFVELADEADLNDQVSIVNPGSTSDSGSGNFTLDLGLQGGVDYRLTIAHISTARASVQEVPEPASIALMAGGLGLLGAFAGRRQRKQR